MPNALEFSTTRTTPPPPPPPPLPPPPSSPKKPGYLLISQKLKNINFLLNTSFRDRKTLFISFI